VDKIVVNADEHFTLKNKDTTSKQLLGQTTNNPKIKEKDKGFFLLLINNHFY